MLDRTYRTIHTWHWHNIHSCTFYASMCTYMTLTYKHTYLFVHGMSYMHIYYSFVVLSNKQWLQRGGGLVGGWRRERERERERHWGIREYTTGIFCLSCLLWLLRCCQCTFAALGSISIWVLVATTFTFKEVQTDTPFFGVTEVLMRRLLESVESLTSKLYTMISGFKVALIFTNSRPWNRSPHVCCGRWSEQHEQSCHLHSKHNFG